jgi:hypothetical protein
VTPEQISALHAALRPAFDSLFFVPGLPERPAGREVEGLDGVHAWTSDWATVLVVPSSEAQIEATSDRVEVWAREEFGLPLRNRPRRDWYMLLAVDRPLAVGVRLAVESTDRVVRRHVVEWRDDSWDLGRIAFLPLGRGGELSAVPNPAPLPEQAQKILNLYRGNSQAVNATLAAIEAEAGQEADDAG